MGTVFGEANKMLSSMAWMIVFTGSFVWPTVHSNQIDSNIQKAAFRKPKTGSCKSQRWGKYDDLVNLSKLNEVYNVVKFYVKSYGLC